MESGASLPEGIDGQRPGGAHLRGAERYTLLVRAARLVADGREYMCVMRDASATGVKLRLFHKLPRARRFELDTGNGQRHAMSAMWEVDDHAGFQFGEPVDVDALLDDHNGEFPKRPIRLGAERAILLYSGSVAHPAVLHNISQGGACVECDQRLMVRQMVRMEIDGLPAMFAKVCWRLHPRHGMVFERQLTIKELAETMLTLHGETGEAGAAKASSAARG